MINEQLGFALKKKNSRISDRFGSKAHQPVKHTKKNLKCQSAYKPGFVWPLPSQQRDNHSSGTELTHCLLQPTRMTSLEKAGAEAPHHPYLVLLPMGFTLPSLLPNNAVGSYPTISPLPNILPQSDVVSGGIISAALSLGSPPPDVIRHRFSMEPGLSSRSKLKLANYKRLPSRLAKKALYQARRNIQQ